MGIVIGPVLKHRDGYSFDVWEAAKGVTRGYPYCQIEDAYYARNAEIRASAQGRAPAAIVCQTLDEFIVQSTARCSLPRDRACAASIKALGLETLRPALVWLSTGTAPFSFSDIAGSM